jgi:tetrahydromethanopterin S-methyltransferase subunit G
VYRMSVIEKGVLILMASAALVLSGYNSLGQSVDDSAARAQLAEEITQKYGVRVGADLSLTQLYAIVVGLNEIYSIARQDHGSLDAEGSRSAEFDEMDARMAMANRINQEYGTNLDWRQYDFLELFLLDQKLRGKSQTAGR